jgi:hypothetical protein
MNTNRHTLPSVAGCLLLDFITSAVEMMAMHAFRQVRGRLFEGWLMVSVESVFAFSMVTSWHRDGN